MVPDVNTAATERLGYVFQIQTSFHGEGELSFRAAGEPF